MGANLRKLFHPVKHVLPGHCTTLKASPVSALLVIIVFINDFRLLKDTESAVQRMHPLRQCWERKKNHCYQEKLLISKCCQI